MNSINVENITQLMHKQIDLLRKLDATLCDEYALLEKKNLDKLDASTQEKTRLLEELRTLEIEMYNTLKSINANPESSFTSLKQLLAANELTNDATLMSLFDTLTQLAEKCSDQNAINGMMIHSHRRINGQFINALKQKFTESSATTYGRNGAQQSSLSFSATNIKA